MAYDWEKLKKRAEQIDNLFGGSKTVTTSEAKRLGKVPVSTFSENVVSKSIERKKQANPSFTPTAGKYSSMNMEQLQAERDRLNQRIRNLRSANQGGLSTFSGANNSNAEQIRESSVMLQEVEDRIRALSDERKTATKELRRYNQQNTNYFDVPLERQENNTPFDIDPASIWSAQEESKKESALRKAAWQEEDRKPVLFFGSIGQTANAAPGVLTETAKEAVSLQASEEYQAALSRLREAERVMQEAAEAATETARSRFPDATNLDFFANGDPAYEAAKRKVEEAQAAVDAIAAKSVVDGNSPAMKAYAEARDTGARFLEGMSPGEQFLGQTALSIGQNLAYLPTALINPSAPLVLMGVSAAADKSYDLNTQGVPATESLIRGAVSGGIEAATEKIPLDHVLSAMRGGTGRTFIQNMLRQAGLEATEEGISYAANYVADKAANDPNATFSVEELVQSAAAGGLSGLFFGAGGSIIGTGVDVVNARNAVGTNQDIVNRVNQRLSAPGQVMSDFVTAGIPLPTVPRPVQSAQNTTVQSPVDAPVNVAEDTAPTPPVTPQQPAQRKQGLNIPVQERTWQDAGNRKVNAFQYDHPELRSYYAEAARSLKYDLAGAVKGERTPTFDADGYITGYTGTSRSVTDPIAQALDNAGLSYAQIDKAIDDLIADNGQENYAAAKKLELVLDDMLTNGYTNSDGYDVPPNEEYIAARDLVNSGQGTEFRMSEEEWNSLMSQEPEGPAFLPTAEYGPESSVGAARKGFDQWSAFQGTKSEFFPEGANAARPVDVPTTDPEGRRVRKTASTAMGAKAIPDEVVGDIQNMVMSGQLSYDRVTDRASTDRAVNRIQSDGFQRALGDFSSAVQKGVVSKDLATLGQQLLINAANAGDANATAELLSLYAQMETTAGQAVQAASILRKLSPTAQLYSAQKSVDSLNKTINEKKSKRPSAEDNVPVEIWMQRVGENLADELASKLNVPKNQVQTVSQTILSDLRRFARETAPKSLRTGKTRTDIDRIVDLFQNKEAYNEAWQAAKDTLSDKFENNPDALSAFDEWLDSSLDYSKMLTKELTGQTEIEIPKDLVEKFLQQTDQAGRDTVMKEIYMKVAEQVPSTFRDKWNAWRYLAMLGNPRTHIRNFFGNALFQPVRYAKDRLAAAIEAGVSAASGGRLQRTKSFAYNPSLYAAAWNDFNNVADVLSGNKYDDVQSVINDNRTIFKFKPLEGLRKGNTNLLGAEDAIFKRITYADSLAGYLSANGVTAEQMKSGTVDPALMSAARDYAGQEALRATFNDKNAFSNRIVQIARPLGVFGEAVLPFKRTPANILMRGFEYSPAGLVKGIYDGVKKGKSGAEVIDEIASGLTGSALMILGGFLAAAGVVTGGAGDDDKQAEFNELTGAQTYALNLPGGGSVTLDWLAPEALPFFMGVQLVNTAGEEGLTPDTIISSLSSISEPMLEMSMLQSLNDLIDNVSFAASNEKLQGLVWSSLVSYFTQAIPTIGGQFERSSEDVRMSTYTDKNSLIPSDAQYALGKASARIPGWDFQQIPFIDEWGRTEENAPLPLRVFNNFLNPAYTSQMNVTPLDEEIQRIYDETGAKGVMPSRAPKYLTVGGERIDLTADQYVQYATERGQMSFEIGSDMVGNKVFSSLPDDEKAEVLDAVYTYADALAKASVSNYELPKWVKAVSESGVNPSAAILYHESDADNETKRRMLMNEDTLSASEKHAIDKAILSDGMFIPKDTDVDYTSEESFAITQLSSAGQRKWEKAKEWGMPYQDYVKYYPICSKSGKKDEIIQDLISAGMSRDNAYTFWNLIKRD